MSNSDKGIIDGLIDDICTGIEMKGAIEASRDENGKVDITKATAISMGLGHTSDDDIAQMAGMLGASGAFDTDGNNDYEPYISDSTYSTTYSTGKRRITKEKYEEERKDANFTTGFATVAAVLGLIMSLYFFEPTSGTFFLIILSFWAFVIYQVYRNREYTLESLEKAYLETLKEETKEKEEEDRRKAKEIREAMEEKVKIEKAQRKINEWKNFVETTDLKEIVTQIDQKLKDILNKAEESVYDENTTRLLLSGLLYLAFEQSDLSDEIKALEYDVAVNWLGFNGEFTGDMLFIEKTPELTVGFKTLVNNIFNIVISLSLENDDEDAQYYLVKTISSMMLKLGDRLETEEGCPEFGRNGMLVTVGAARRVFDSIGE